MADVAIRAGDRLPQLNRQFTLNGTGVDLTGATVVFNMWNAATGTQVIADAACTIVTAATGNVRYLWTSSDATLPAGVYLASFKATYPDTRTLTAPNDSMISVEIYAQTGSTWSYTGNPGARAIDAIRFLIGDTDSNDQLLSDEEISWINAEASGTPTGLNAIYDAAYRACLAVAASLSRLADKSIGDLSVQLSQKAAGYRATATEMKTLAFRKGLVPTPYAGGISISDKDIDDEDSDSVRPYFRTGQFENFRDGGQQSDMRGNQWFGPGADV